MKTGYMLAMQNAHEGVIEAVKRQIETYGQPLLPRYQQEQEEAV